MAERGTRVVAEIQWVNLLMLGSVVDFVNDTGAAAL